MNRRLRSVFYYRLEGQEFLYFVNCKRVRLKKIREFSNMLPVCNCYLLLWVDSNEFWQLERIKSILDHCEQKHKKSNWYCTVKSIHHQYIFVFSKKSWQLPQFQSWDRSQMKVLIIVHSIGVHIHIEFVHFWKK